MSKNNGEYWARRMKIMEESLLNKDYRYVKNIDRQFKLAEKTIQKEIAAWYQRFAVNNEITLSEARKMLTADELEEFHWTVKEYIQKGKSLDESFKKALENASIRVHISRLDSLKLQLRYQSELLHENVQADTEQVVRDTYEKGYYQTAFEFQKGLGFGWTMHAINDREINTILSKPWTADGQTFKDRCWTNKEALVNTVNTQLTQMIMRGKSPDQVIDVIAKQFEVSKRKAGRLVMTESAAFANMAQRDSFKDLGVEQYVIVSSLDRDVCRLCGSLDGKHFKMSEYETGVTAPPFHPWCRCCTAPYYDDWEELGLTGGFRAARDPIDDKTYEVPRDMTYQTWFKKTFTNPDEARYNVIREKVGKIVKTKYSKKINQGLQDKHIPGTNNYDSSRGTLTADPQELYDRYAGKGQPITVTNPKSGAAGTWNQRERFEHFSPIGTYKDMTGTELETNVGMIHYSKKKGWHIVPAKPTR